MDHDVPLTLLAVADRQIATRIRLPARLGRPVLLFLPGYASDMEGGKATALDGWCAALGLGCARLDYSGTGSSEGAFADGTLDRWLDEVLALVDALPADSPLLVAGSSMGGWLMLHVALRRPERVAALLGIAAAPDFTDWGFEEGEKDDMKRLGKLEEDNPYGPEPFVTYLGFWESGEAMRLLDEDIPLTLPVRLVHGELDRDVPVSIALRLMRRLQSGDVQLRLIKKGAHRLSEPNEIAAILDEARALVEQIEAVPC